MMVGPVSPLTILSTARAQIFVVAVCRIYTDVALRKDKGIYRGKPLLAASLKARPRCTCSLTHGVSLPCLRQAFAADYQLSETQTMRTF